MEPPGPPPRFYTDAECPITVRYTLCLIVSGEQPMSQRGNPRIAEYARAGSDAQKARHPATELTAAARASSPGNLDRWLAEVRAEHPDISDSDAEQMARARQSEHFRKIGAARRAG